MKKIVLGAIVLIVIAAIIGSRTGSNSTSPTTAPSDPSQGNNSKETPQTDQQQEQPLTERQENYIAYARMYQESRQTGKPSVMDLENSAQIIGTLPGNFQIIQILDSRTMIACRISGEYDLPGQSVYIEGMNTKGDADGHKFSLGDTLFVRKTPKTYETVLGANRTIYTVEALNTELWQWALQQLDTIHAKEKAKEAEERAKRVAKARSAYDQAIATLDKFEKDNAKISNQRTYQSQIQMLEPFADKPQFAEKLKDYRRALADIGEISPADITLYTTRRDELNRNVDTARRAITEASR